MTNETEVTDLWNYGCAVLRNASCDYKRHEKVINKHNISFEAISNSPDFQKFISYRQELKFTGVCRYIIQLWGEKIEFGNESLIRAMSELDSESLKILILYYVLEKTDSEICSLLNLNARQTVQYKRKKAIQKLRELLPKEEAKNYVLL